MRKFRVNNLRYRTKKTHEVVASVLNPSDKSKPLNRAKKDAFYSFLVRSMDREFENSLDIILKDDEVFSFLNQTKMPTDHLISRDIVGAKNIKNTRLLRLFQGILIRESNKLVEVNRLRTGLEDLFIKGMFDEVNQRLDEINSITGISIFEMNYRIAVLTAKNDFELIDALVEKWKTDEISENLYDVIRVSGWKSHSVEASTTIETIVRRSNKEYIEGGALSIAAFYSIMCLQYPLYDDVDLRYVLNWLQLLPLIDLYDALQKTMMYLLTKNDITEWEIKDFIPLFENLNTTLKLESLAHYLQALKGNTIKYKITTIDKEVSEYTAGNYSGLLDRLEENINNIDNLITKVNIIAKSYIYSTRKPKGLPPFLMSIINNLISIYSLKDSNQAISQLINLSIIYSSLEVSDHILISIMKAAPFFFEENKKQQIIEKSKFLSTPLTPLACNLESPPSLYIDYSSEHIDAHRELKREAIDAISNFNSDAIRLINEYDQSTLIKKDSIELMVEYYLKNDNIIDLIGYSTDQLIKNPNANICLPLEDIVNFINDEKKYSLDSVICAHYYNLYSHVDKSEVLNEFFEEYIISLGVERPSELFGDDLSDKEVILLKDIAKIDVMDYLGCFDDENDLKIERIKILNKLVSQGYLKQSDIDKECKYIVDGILIDSEAARFNNAKIFVDTKHIYEKRKKEIEGFISKYHGDNVFDILDVDVKYQIEDFTILKGDKNIIVGRIINTLLVEYFNNKEVGLDINLSSEIRHGFFGNLICSSPQSKRLITELDENGKYKSNVYWIEYYNMINDYILNDIDCLLVKFSEDFNKLIDTAENWMKTSLNGDEKDRVFFFSISLDDFLCVKNMLDANQTSDEIAALIFTIFNTKLENCLYLMKTQLNITFAALIDDLFSELIESINQAKRGTSMSSLLDEIQLSNTEVKEHIRTVCEWFSLKKNIHLEKIELEKLIHLAVKCFQQINNCDIKMEIQKDFKYFISGTHLYVLVLCLINFLNNSYKFSKENLSVKMKISGNENGRFRISILNEMSDRAKDLLKNGHFEKICEKLVNMNDNDLLLNNGGSGLYKCLHALKNVSKLYNIIPSYEGDIFCVEITYGY
ncbi:histidine kinase [Pectobacterium brasiliense]|uniref:hypothetical protein n=1 Tax=Pectobacterium brasiliense TaxID=180957 RepID=UPI000651C02D|nr:hypothetical protein [Pectobacterium brasiliense]KMK83033.1 hypothetical protein KCO_15567 [Pectobacterium brasiliense ICMP 19477]